MTVPGERQVKDIFCSDLGWVDVIGRNIRINLVVDVFSDEGAAPVRMVVAPIVMPIDVIHSAIQRVLFALGETAPSLAYEMPRRLS